MADEPTPSELVRIIDRNHADTREIITELKTQLIQLPQQFAIQLRDYVLKDVYAAEIKALKAEVEDARQDHKELKAEVSDARKSTRTAVVGAIGSFVAALALAVVLGFLKGGGH